VTVNNVTPPSISGTAQQGHTLSTSNGTWTFDLDYLTYAYQWLRCDALGASCVDIAGATGGSYLLKAADVGSTIRSEVTASEHTSPPPSGAYFDEDFTNIANPPWVSIQTTAGSTGPDPGGNTCDAANRLCAVTAPDGVGRAFKFEIRDSDPGWPQDPTVDRTQLASSPANTWNQPALVPGDIRWFDLEIWLPTEFDYARANWNTWVGVHPGGNSWGCFDIGGDGMGSHPAYMPFKVAGGSPTGTTANLVYIPLIQLTNSNGTPYMPNRNRRISLIYGGKFNPDNTGWLEIWLDGVNVFPRTNRPTMWAGDVNTYFKVGPYKNKANHFPSGKTVMYFTRIAIGDTRPF